VPIGPFLLALAAAVLHALWNSAVKISADRLIAVSLITAGAVLITIPVAAVVGLPPRAALPYLIVSPLVHSCYVLCLSIAYDRADLSVAYPIARGSAPLLVTAGGVLFLGDNVSALGYVGVILVATALATMVFGVGRPDGVWWAVLTGLFISAYSLLDAAGVRAGDAGMRYASWLFITHASLTVLVMFVLRSPQEIRTVFKANWVRIAAAGVASGAAYLMVLYATQRAAAGLVSGIRETSVVFGVFIGVFALKEKATSRHMVAVAFAAAGAVLIGLS
jgi:drug/metabolite transporter (DMT)-like permease